MNTIILGIIIIVAIIGPIWYMMYRLNKGKRLLHKELQAAGKAGGFNITDHELWGNKVLGMDREGEKAAFAILKEQGSDLFVADLKKFSRCYADKISQENKQKMNGSDFSNIAIRFSAKEKGAADLVFPLFTGGEGMTMSNEPDIADEWVEKFNGIIRKNLV